MYTSNRMDDKLEATYAERSKHRTDYDAQSCL